jgi:regulation of enolase protein 1 (concanavalin A-like superfamily)
MEKLIFVFSLFLLSKANFTWFNEPKMWSSNETTINVHTDGNTDFWSKTHYGFERDTGHFYYQSLPGDQSFTATVNVRGKYHTMYDQGGLMVRIDKNNWIKCGVEYVDGQQFASAVVTVNGWSDWNVVSINAPEVLKLNIERKNEVVHINFTEGKEGNSKMMRLAYLPVIDGSQTIMVGIMCASPVEDTQGFDISFEDLSIMSDHYKSGSIHVCCHYMFLYPFISFLLSLYISTNHMFYNKNM